MNRSKSLNGLTFIYDLVLNNYISPKTDLKPDVIVIYRDPRLNGHGEPALF